MSKETVPPDVYWSCEAGNFYDEHTNSVAKTWRHKKRGTTYAEVGRGRLQIEGDLDMSPVVIYRADADGSLWVRLETEFEDGRFERR